MSKRKLNTLRIIGGRWRRRLIHFPELPQLRPTHDRIRETLFNWLQPYIVGSCCLDLFAGSGALGFEALSRGAAKVTFVDSHPEVINHIYKTSQLFAIDSNKIEMVLGRCPDQTLAFRNSPYDIVFLDPPFDTDRLDDIMFWLEAHHHLSNNALIYLEIEKRREICIPKQWQCIKEKSTKSIAYFLFHKEGSL